VHSDVGIDLAWWSGSVNDEFVYDDIQADPVHQLQESLIESNCDSFESLSTQEARSSSIEAAFQTTSQPSGFYQQSFELNIPASYDIDFEQEALSAFPDATYSKVVQDSTPPPQSGWNLTSSSSTLRFDGDSHDNIGRGFRSLPNETLHQESPENRKIPISQALLSTCPCCSKTFSSMRISTHIQMCSEKSKHPFRCEPCGEVLTSRKDLSRHQESKRHHEKSTTHRNGSIPAQEHACTCGKKYQRKDGLLRHIRGMTERPDDDTHLAVQVGPSN